MRVMVTGATGFLGRRLCSTLLEDGHALMGLSQTGRSGDNQNPMSITYVSYKMGEALPKVVIDYSPQVIVHLAWDGIPDFSEEKCLENVEAQLRFFKETERLSDLKKIIVTGTCREYGAKQGACLEGECFSPDSYFSWAKQTLRDYLTLTCQKRAVNMLWFRLFYVYGPGQRAGSLIPTLIKAFKTNTDPIISDPSASNDFIYIDDVVSAFVKAIENEDCRGTFNLGSGHISSVAEITKLVEYAVLSSDRFSSQLGKKSSEIKKSPSMWADINLSSHYLGWKPKISLAEGITRTCQLDNYE
jgi:nucleoside-diphosphate-sugar epimerase